MNILVTGANGQLGNEMRIIAGQSADNYIFTDVNQVEGLETTYLDITDLAAVRRMVEEGGIKAIVNCAAWTNVDAAEDPEKYALVEKLNATAPENLATAMKEAGGLLIQISTDYVFGKEPYNTPCSEDRKGTPTGVYGATKLLGEQKIMATGCDHVIIRTAWLYSEFGKNFCKTMLDLTSTRPALNVVFDQCGTPTYALDLAKAIAAVLKDYSASVIPTEADASADVISTERKRVEKSPYPKTGIYHYSNEGVTSWYDFTRMILRISNSIRAERGESPAVCDIRPCHSSEFPSAVVRPAYSVLDKTTIKDTFGITVPYWVDSLEACIRNMADRQSQGNN